MAADSGWKKLISVLYGAATMIARKIHHHWFFAAAAALAIAVGGALAEDAAMNDSFVPLEEGFWAAPQITPDDIAAAKALGVTLIINNRPDGEAIGQPRGEEIEAAAKAAGLSYVAIPVGPAGVGDRQLDAFDAAVADNHGGVLAFCRTGTRSTTVWALAKARAGAPAEEIIREAADAGYNLAGIAPRLEALSKAADR